MKTSKFNKPTPTERSSKSVQLSLMAEYAALMSRVEFNKLISSLLEAIPGHIITLTDDTSNPDRFDKVVLALDQISLVVLSSMDELDDLTTVLQMDFIHRQGIIRFQHHWTAYKKINADELVYSLRALHQISLNVLVVTKNQYGDLEEIDDDAAIFIKTIFNLIGDDYYSGLDDNLYQEAAHVLL